MVFHGVNTRIDPGWRRFNSYAHGRTDCPLRRPQSPDSPPRRPVERKLRSQDTLPRRDAGDDIGPRTSRDPSLIRTRRTPCPDPPPGSPSTPSPYTPTFQPEPARRIRPAATHGRSAWSWAKISANICGRCVRFLKRPWMFCHPLTKRALIARSTTLPTSGRVW